MADRDEMVARFVELTTTQPDTARATLEASNWQLEDALNLFYAAPLDDAGAATRSSRQPQVEAELDEDDWDAPQTIRQTAPPPPGAVQGLGRTLAGGSAGDDAAAAAPEPRAAVQPPRRRGGGLMTLGDLKSGGGGGHGHDHSDDDSDEGQDMFAGGEKSGLAVENPNRQGGRGEDTVKRILKQAQEGSKARQRMQEEDEEESTAPRSFFTGRGQTLGSDDVPSREIADPYAALAKKPEKVVRNLYFWRDGFSIEDGPLMRYDDPQHQETLRGIEAGRAPLHLMNVEPGQFTDVNVHRKMDEDYVAPKKKFVPFAGGGNRLGAPTPGFESNVGASSSTAPAASAPAAPPPQTIDVDNDQPTTSLQIRLGDGTRLVSRFNHTHTIANVYAFVNAANVASRARGYVLQTTFPVKELKDMDRSLKEAGLLNAVVVQKWT